jgi:hypothetical protein
MDANTIDDDEDMFVEMRLALRLHREPVFGAASMTPANVLGLATTGGAKLLRRESSLGRIEPGFAADMSVVNLDRVTWPWVAPECDPLSLTVPAPPVGTSTRSWSTAISRCATACRPASILRPPPRNSPNASPLRGLPCGAGDGREADHVASDRLVRCDPDSAAPALCRIQLTPLTEEQS